MRRRRATNLIALAGLAATAGLAPRRAGAAASNAPPAQLSGRTVVLDPGHGGSDTGAIS